MFSFLLRVLTIVGSFTLAAVLTRRYLRRAVLDDAGRNGENGPSAIDSELELDTAGQSKAGAASESHRESTSDLNARKKKRAERKASRHSKPQQAEASAEEESAEECISEPAEPEPEPEASTAVSSAVGGSKSASVDRQDFSVPAEAASKRARVVIDSSKQILDNYKQPEGLSVDLSLAHFSLDTAERLMTQSKFDEAWQKAGAVGMLVGMSEMRAGIETQLKSLKSDESSLDKVKNIRAILNEADRFLAEASKSFVSDEPVDGTSPFMNHLQAAFQKTTEAQSELLKVVV